MSEYCKSCKELGDKITRLQLAAADRNAQECDACLNWERKTCTDGDCDELSIATDESFYCASFKPNTVYNVTHREKDCAPETE